MKQFLEDLWNFYIRMFWVGLRIGAVVWWLMSAYALVTGDQLPIFTSPDPNVRTYPFLPLMCLIVTSYFLWDTRHVKSSDLRR